MLLKDKLFPKKRQSGILLPLSALPSPHGIGDLGSEAYSFVDFLKNSHQRLWQLLPLCPIGKGNSPYSSSGAFAGEILFISLELLANEGLISSSELPQKPLSGRINYPLCRKLKLSLLKKAAAAFNTDDPYFKAFKEKHSHWLYDYSLFMALKDRFGGLPFYEWEDPYKYRIPSAMEAFRIEAKEEIAFYEVTQYLFYTQFSRLRDYTATSGIKLVGDIPFYVQLDSADVWAHPEYFKLGRDMKPMLVAGVPPDIFSPTGQLWGNPVYDWEQLKRSDYDWWKKRLGHSLELFDILRIDHFRAFADYYTVPSGAADATAGRWEKGVGMQFWDKMGSLADPSRIIAEDLGGETREVRSLIRNTGFPDMKVLQFAFDSGLSDPFLPRNMNRNTVCYTGTHDNNTTLGWWKELPPEQRGLFEKLVPNRPYDSPALRLIAFGMRSRANTVIIPLQDYLSLPGEARTNTPGRPFGNWEWRLSGDELTPELVKTVRTLSLGRNR